MFQENEDKKVFRKHELVKSLEMQWQEEFEFGLVKIFAPTVLFERLQVPVSRTAASGGPGSIIDTCLWAALLRVPVPAASGLPKRTPIQALLNLSEENNGHFAHYGWHQQNIYVSRHHQWCKTNR